MTQNILVSYYLLKYKEKTNININVLYKSFIIIWHNRIKHLKRYITNITIINSPKIDDIDDIDEIDKLCYCAFNTFLRV